MVSRRWLIFLLVGLVLPVLVSAFTVTIDPVKPAIRQGESAMFLIHVTNTEQVNETYRLLFLEPNWMFMTDPIIYYLNGFTVKPGESMTIPVTITPKKHMTPYVYLLELRIARENANESKVFFLPIEVKSTNRSLGEFLVAVSRLVDIPRDVDPRNPLRVTVHLKNRNPRVIKDFAIRVDTPFGTRVAHTKLEGFEEKSVPVELTLPRNATPGEYGVNVTLNADGEYLDPVIRDSFRIIPYTDVQENISRQWGFFTFLTHVTLINKGNAPAHIEIPMRLPASLLIHLSSFRLANKTLLDRTLVVNRTGAYAVTALTLPPGEAIQVEGRISYAIFFWIAVFLIGGWILYSIMRSPVQVRKDAVVVGVSQGGVSEIRIVLHVKNLSGKKRFKDITIIDPLPRLVELIREKDDRFGRPRVYMNEREGSVIKWYIESLEPYEERIITYRVRSRLSLLGKITLPRAILTFKDDGSEQITRSNQVRLDF